MLFCIAFSVWVTGCAPSVKDSAAIKTATTTPNKPKKKRVKPSSVPHPNLEKIKAKRKAIYDSLVLVNTDTSKFVFIEHQPEFPGGPRAMMHYIGSSMRYPATAQRDKVSGRVIGTFIINENGEITEPEILKSVRWDVDNEFLRIVKGMPAWIPGFQNGKAVKVKFTVPVYFGGN